MAAQIVVTGPTTFTFNGAFVGTCQIRPRVLFRREWEPVFNDIGGKVPLDWQYMGQDALVIGDFTRHDPAVIAAIRALPGELGVDTVDSLGTPMVQEGKAGNLTLNFLRSGGGISFPAAWLQGPDMEEEGTRHQIQRLIFYCARTFDPGTFAQVLFTPL
jgi:hypothetical protein